MNRSRVWKMTRWDNAAEATFSAAEFLLGNAISAVGLMIAATWLDEFVEWGNGASFLEAMLICVIVRLINGLQQSEADRYLGQPYTERLARTLVAGLGSVGVMLGVAGILILCLLPLS